MDYHQHELSYNSGPVWSNMGWSEPLHLQYFFLPTVEAELPLLPTCFCFYIPELYAPGSRGLNGISRVKWNRNMSLYEAPVRMGPPEGIVCWAAVWSDRNLVIFGEKLTRLCQQSPLHGYYKSYSAAQLKVSGLQYWKEKEKSDIVDTESRISRNISARGKFLLVN